MELSRIDFALMKVLQSRNCTAYATLKEAEDIVCERNQNRIESVAEKCKGSIPMCAYEAMLNWDVRLAMCG